MTNVSIAFDFLDHGVKPPPGYTVPKGKEFFFSKGKKHRRRTTAGWKLLTRCKDGSEQWVPLKDMKETYPVQVSLFAKTEGIIDEPAFSW